ncbi:MAG: HTH domain-containing protein, partial [Verrucomicrobia bacterium]|nr:HTH domain-containing protein [Verrucomicrobiota bacterium]
MMMSTLSHILRALRNDAGTGVHGTDISQKLGISRAAVWSHIEELRSLGYEINAGPHKGYRLTEVPDVLIADDLTSQLSEDQIIGNQIRVFRETASTNQLVDQIGLAGEPEGLVIFAESQTQGRGRLGRQWISPSKKGLWFSVLLRPALRPPQMTQLTVIAATALARAIRETTPLIPEI